MKTPLNLIENGYKNFGCIVNIIDEKEMIRMIFYSKRNSFYLTSTSSKTTDIFVLSKNLYVQL